MIKPINRDVNILRQVSQPASKADLPVAQDLRDTLTANANRCVGMAANMIGVTKHHYCQSRAAPSGNVQSANSCQEWALPGPGGLSLTLRTAFHDPVSKN